MTDHPPCSDIARAREEPLYGTASRTRYWWLIEHRGPWGPNAITDSTLHPALVFEINKRAKAAGARALLIRSAGGDEAERTSFVAFSGIDGQWIRRFSFSNPAELLNIDLPAMKAVSPPGEGEPLEDPLYLVCTHGEHDPCCGRFGAPVYESLAATRGSRTWECSHVGGDRFAGNLVCLPHGLFFGHVEPAEVGRIADLYERGEIDLARYRGRSAYEPVVQAADAMLRIDHGAVAIDDLAFERRVNHSDGDVTIGFRRDDESYVEIRLEADRATRRFLTCGANREAAPRRFVRKTERVS